MSLLSRKVKQNFSLTQKSPSQPSMFISKVQLTSFLFVRIRKVKGHIPFSLHFCFILHSTEVCQCFMVRESTFMNQRRTHQTNPTALRDPLDVPLDNQGPMDIRSPVLPTHQISPLILWDNLNHPLDHLRPPRRTP